MSDIKSQSTPKTPSKTRPTERWLKSAHAAAHHYHAMLGDRQLDVHRDRLLRLTARLMVHAENLSRVLHALGEDQDSHQVATLLRELRHLHKEIRANLTYIFEAEGEDIFSQYRGEA